MLGNKNCASASSVEMASHLLLLQLQFNMYDVR